MKSITTKISSLLLVGLIVFQACKKETQPTPNNNNPDPCANVSITISATATPATPCSSTNNSCQWATFRQCGYADQQQMCELSYKWWQQWWIKPGQQMQYCYKLEHHQQ